MGFRYDIPGLRALAVLLVFIFHLNSSWLTGGFIGVDIFFVISGFLVSGIILHKIDKGTFGFIDFYLGRIKRIVPVFLLLLIVVGIVGSFVFLSMDIKTLRMYMFQSAIFNSNNYFATIDTYFGASSKENPLLHTWTLSLEMQFYFLLPCFLYLCKRKNIIPISIFLILFLFVYSVYNSTMLGNQSAMYFSLFARIPEFLIGTVFAIKAKEIQSFIGNRQNVYAFTSFVGILVCAIFFSEKINYPGLWVLLPCLSAGVLLVTTESLINKLFSANFFVHVGELSYSIYLWHWAIMAFIRYYFVKVDFSFIEIVFVIVLTYALSWGSYKLVENKFRAFETRSFFWKFSIIVFSLGIISFKMPDLNKRVTSIPSIFVQPTFGMNSHGSYAKSYEVIGDKKGLKSFCLIGDSHTLAYKQFFDVIGKKHHLSIKTISNNSYPLIGALVRKDFANDQEFELFNNLMLISSQIINESNYIFISSSWWDKISSLESVFGELVSSLRADQQIIIVGDYPVFDENLIRLNRSIFIKDNDYRLVGEVKALPKFVKNKIENSKKVLYLELNYCDIKNDLPFINDTIGYYDGKHLNAYGSEKLANYFESTIEEFLILNKIIKSK